MKNCVRNSYFQANNLDRLKTRHWSGWIYVIFKMKLLLLIKFDMILSKNFVTKKYHFWLEFGWISKLILDIAVAALGFQIHGFPKNFSSNGRGMSMISKLKTVKMFLFLPFFRDIDAPKYFFMVFAWQTVQNPWVPELFFKIPWVLRNPWNPS